MMSGMQTVSYHVRAKKEYQVVRARGQAAIRKPRPEASRGAASDSMAKRYCRRLVAAGSLALALSLCAGCRPHGESVGEPAVDETELPADDLRAALDEVLEWTYRGRQLSVQHNAAWQVMHGVLAYQREFLVERDGEEIPAVDYLLGGGSMRGWDVEVVTDPETGRRGLRALLELGSQAGQGHTDQWLANMAQAGLSLDQTLRVVGETVTMQDWVHQSQLDVPRNMEREYSWTLIALNRYLPTDATWTASDGQTWSIARLVEIEAGQDLRTSACGGTHRAIALALALKRHRSEGGTLEGSWADAERVVQQAIANARRYQNPDGSLSTRFFESPGSSPDLGQNLGSTGHTLEFLSIAVDDSQLNEPWLRRAVAYLCDVFRATRDVPLECGALYHAAHGLILYRARVFGPRSYGPPVSAADPAPSSP